MERRRISAAITFVICILGTSPRLIMGRGTATDTEYEHSYFNSSWEAADTSSAGDQMMMMPPMDLLMEMSKAETVEEFMKYVDMSSIDPRDSLVNPRVMALERGLLTTPKLASCMPMPVEVKLVADDEPDKNITNVYFPPCTRVNRCGGCCLHQLLECRMVASELLTFQLIKSVWDFHTNKFVYHKKQIATVEQHTKCACSCKQKESDCNAKQKYFGGQCQCVCQTPQNEQNCNSKPNPDKWIWSHETCECECEDKDPKQCTTGQIFNPEKCECQMPKPPPFYRVPLPSDGDASFATAEPPPPAIVNTPLSVEDRKKFIIKAIPLPSADTTKYTSSSTTD